MLVAFGKVDMNVLLDSLILMAQDITITHEHNIDKGPGQWIHADGWGIAYLEGQNWVIKKSEKAIFEDPAVDDLRTLKPSVVILHARFKTEGGVSLNDTHPFAIENFVFCHNGTIRGDIPHANFKPKGTTDSEKMFYNILADLDDNPEILRQKLSEVEIHTGSNIILGTPEKTYVAIHFKKDPIYYKMALGQDKDTLIVSSELLSKFDLEWEHLDDGDVVVVNNRNLTWEILKPQSLQAKI
jgi:predicted glutamine amidotransferase